MKTELSKIAKDLEQGTITENEAKTLLLGLFGINLSVAEINRLIKLASDEITATALNEGCSFGLTEKEYDEYTFLVKKFKGDEA